MKAAVLPELNEKSVGDLAIKFRDAIQLHIGRGQTQRKPVLEAANALAVAVAMLLAHTRGEADAIKRLFDEMLAANMEDAPAGLVLPFER
jgi:alpha-galactosidase/6-phospho-beta-glucosidase family protein